MSLTRTMALLTVLGAVLLLPLHGAMAQSDEAFIKYRQKVMGSLGANMGGIGDILKEGLPFKGNIQEHAAAINATAKNIVAAFEKNIAAGATDAKSDVWKDWSDFKAKVKDLEDASAALMKASMGSDMAMTGNAVKALGKACGDCHKPFRKPKEESYKNK